MPRKREPALPTRERILLEASRLLSLHGYHGTTTRAIAEAVGISQPSLFFHFASKKAILEELGRLDLIPAVERLEGLLEEPASPAAKLYAMLVGELTAILSSPYDLRAHLSPAVLDDPDLAEYRNLLTRLDELTRSLVRSGQAAGEFAGGDPWVTQHLVSALTAWATIAADDIPADRRRSFAAETAAIATRGLLEDPAMLDRVRMESRDLYDRYYR